MKKKHCQRHNGPRVLSLKLEFSLQLNWLQIQFSWQDNSSHRLNTLGPLFLTSFLHFSGEVYVEVCRARKSGLYSYFQLVQSKLVPNENIPLVNNQEKWRNTPRVNVYQEDCVSWGGWVRSSSSCQKQLGRPDGQPSSLSLSGHLRLLGARMYE